MKVRILVLFILLAATSATVFAQKSDKKAAKEQRKKERINEVKAMLDAKEFVFVANRAMPQGYKSMDLTTNPNYVKFHTDKIESSMPYFGRAYNIGYGGDSGLKFEGPAEDYTIEPTKKGNLVKAKVKDTTDSYQISMTVSSDGSASLTISSNNRNSITYSGEINAPKRK